MIKVLSTYNLYLTDCFQAEDYAKDYCLIQVIGMWKQIQAIRNRN